MKNLNKNSFLFKDISSIKGVGKTLEKYLKNKKVDKVKDLLLDLPYEVIDRSEITSLDKLEIGKITTIQVTVKKYNFPRIRNLPNKVICSDENNKINIIFFNSREGYIRKILPLNKQVIISGKINFYKKNYQITNPTYVKEKNLKDKITKIFHYARFDIAALKCNLEINTKNIFCTKIASKLARTYTNKHGLKDLMRMMNGIQSNF